MSAHDWHERAIELAGEAGDLADVIEQVARELSPNHPRVAALREEWQGIMRRAAVCESLSLGRRVSPW